MDEHQNPQEAADSAKDHVKAAADDFKSAASAKAEEIRRAAEKRAEELRRAAEGESSRIPRRGGKRVDGCPIQGKNLEDRRRSLALRDNPTKAIFAALGLGFVLGLMFRK